MREKESGCAGRRATPGRQPFPWLVWIAVAALAALLILAALGT